MAKFMLHERLAAETFVLGDFPLCRLLLMNDSQYPWFILVPRRDAVSEIYGLPQVDQEQLLHESTQLSLALMRAFKGDKLNVAALGNVVPQLHLHHVVRYKIDPAWPAPIWGKHPPKPYTDSEREARLGAVLTLLTENFVRARKR